jgi:hypothetical protein
VSSRDPRSFSNCARVAERIREVARLRWKSYSGDQLPLHSDKDVLVINMDKELMQKLSFAYLFRHESHFHDCVYVEGERCDVQLLMVDTDLCSCSLGILDLAVWALKDDAVAQVFKIID